MTRYHGDDRGVGSDAGRCGFAAALPPFGLSPVSRSQSKTAAAIAKCQHDWLLFANELVAVRVCRCCGLQEDVS